jgi:hypothetical protein
VVEAYNRGRLLTNILPLKCAARKSINRQVEMSTLKKTLPKNSTDYNVSLAAQSLSVALGVHLLFLLFMLLTSTSGASMWLAKMTLSIYISCSPMSHLME